MKTKTRGRYVILPSSPTSTTVKRHWLDELLKQCGVFRENQEVQERVMDSNDTRD